METEMADSSSQPLDLDAIRSRIIELSNMQSLSDDSETSSLESEKLIKECAFELQSKIDQVLSDYTHDSSLEVDDLDKYLECLRGDLASVEADNAKISDEIDVLMRTCADDSKKLACDLEELNCSLDFVSQDLEKATNKGSTDCPTLGQVQISSLKAHGGHDFKILELDNEIEKNKRMLKSLEDLDSTFKRFEAVEKIEDAFAAIKVIEFDGNSVRLSLRTYFPNLETLPCQQKIEDLIEPQECNHELLIEVVEGTMELKNVEIFPNDVYIGEIVDTAKSFRQLFSPLPVLETRSSLEWFVRRVQDRIVLCTLRRLAVKCANRSRHSFEYIDRDEMIVAHMVGGVDAFIKVSQGWPISNSALKLISLKSSTPYSKEISLSFLCKVEEEANSLDTHVRQNVSNFVDCIEEILRQQMRAELQSDTTTNI